jgi:long-chain acyl-CoA synthetase
MKQYAVAARYEVSETETAFSDVLRNASEQPDEVVVSKQVATGGWQPVTCSQLADEVDALAAGLMSAGIGAGQRVAIMSRTRYEWMLADLAILSVGAVTVPIYETSSDTQVDWILRDSGAVAIFVEDAERAARVTALAGTIDSLSSIWTFADDLPRLEADGHRVASDDIARRRAAVRAHDIATIVYTSGTTGRPKGCMLTHANLVATVRNIALADGVADLVFNEAESTLLFLPLAHILARVIQCSALHQRVRLGHLADMKSVPAGLQSFQPTVVLSVPRVFEKIYNTAAHTATSRVVRRVFVAAAETAVRYSRALDQPRGVSPFLGARHALYDRLVYGKLRQAMGGGVRWAVSGGAPLGPQLGHFFRGAGVNVLEGYGLTETTAGGTLNLPSAQRVGSVGRPIPGCEIKIDADGEILMRGPHVFAGYWNNPSATAEVLDEDGWFRTGDIGHIDEDGFVFITDRKKDIIVTAAGKNVAPTALEDSLRAHWLVSQAVVFGDRRPFITALLTLDVDALATWKKETGRADDVPTSALARDPDLLAEVQRAVDEANATVSTAEAIKKWRLLSSDFSEAGGELTPTMKLKRNVIAEEFAREVEALYAESRS